MEKQVYTQADFNKAYNKIKDKLPDFIKEACNLESFKTILRDVLADTYDKSITNYETMLAKLKANSDPVYRSCVLAIIYPFTETHIDQTIKKIIEDLYNPNVLYKRMRIEYDAKEGFWRSPMGFVALQMKYFDQTRKESEALSRESKKAIIKIYEHFLMTGEMLKWYFDEESNIYNLRDEKKPGITILSLSPTQYSEMLFFDYEAKGAVGAVERYAAALRDDTAVHAAAAHAAAADPGDGAYSVPPPPIGRGGSRRRRRTAHRKRKSHRKSKRVHQTRRKHTRRHRHSRRR